MKRFARAITDIAVRQLDVILTCADVLTETPYADRILHDALYESESVHNKGYSHICKLYKLSKTMLKTRWKYSEIYGRNALFELVHIGWAHVVEREPKI